MTPHHLLLTDERLQTYDPVNKVNPPLRTDDDALALRRALADGTVDCVATDHAPHAAQDKDCEWSAAKPGMLGLQTALGIVTRTMVRSGLLDWRGVARVLSERPAEIAGLTGQGRPIAVGEPANLALVDPDAEWTVRAAELAEQAQVGGVQGPADQDGGVALALGAGQVECVGQVRPGSGYGTIVRRVGRETVLGGERRREADGDELNEEPVLHAGLRARVGRSYARERSSARVAAAWASRSSLGRVRARGEGPQRRTGNVDRGAQAQLRSASEVRPGDGLWGALRRDVFDIGPHSGFLER